MKLNKTDDRVQELIKVATKLFILHGFDGTSLGMIIADTGGSRRIIYEKFKNKEGLFTATVHAMLERPLSTLGDLFSSNKNIELTLVDIGITFMNEITKKEPIALWRMLLGEASRFPHLSSLMYEKGPCIGYKLISNYLKQQCQKGIIKLDNIDLSAKQFSEMIIGPIFCKSLFCLDYEASELEIRTHVEYGVKTFLKGALTKS